MSMRDRLLKISQELSTSNLDELVYLCEFETEKIKSGTDLLAKLERKGELSAGNYGRLKELLDKIGRKDLAATLPAPSAISGGDSVVPLPTPDAFHPPMLPPGPFHPPMLPPGHFHPPMLPPGPFHPPMLPPGPSLSSALWVEDYTPNFHAGNPPSGTSTGRGYSTTMKERLVLQHRGHITTMKERMLIQYVFQDLRDCDLERLLYIYSGEDGIPKDVADNIKTSTKFLTTVEEHGLLDYNSLSSHLHSIGRVDIATCLCQQLVPVLQDVPASFKAPAQLVFIKHRCYVTSMEKLQPTESMERRWRIQFEEAAKFLENPLAMDEIALLAQSTTASAQPAASTILTGLVQFLLQSLFANKTEEVRASLESVFKCGSLFIRAHSIVVREAPVPDPEEMKWYVEGCIAHFNEFKQSVTRVVETRKENPLLGSAVDLVLSSWKTEERRDVEACNAQKACDVIQEVSKLLWQCNQCHVNEEHENAKSHIKILESYTYAAGHWKQMLPWLSILLSTDLSQHSDALKEIVTEQWVEITNGYSVIAEIVGQDVLQEVAKKLPGVETPSSDIVRESSFDLLPTPLYVFSILLAAKALGCTSVDTQKAGQRLVELMLKREQLCSLIEMGVSANRKTTYGMLRAVGNYRKCLIDACWDTQLRKDIETALPDIVA